MNSDSTRKGKNPPDQAVDPSDDFEDFESLGEEIPLDPADAEYYDDDPATWDDGDVSSEDDSAAPAKGSSKKPRKPLDVNKLIMGGGILVALGVFVLTIMGDDQGTTVSSPAAETTQIDRTNTRAGARDFFDAARPLEDDELSPEPGNANDPPIGGLFDDPSVLSDPQENPRLVRIERSSSDSAALPTPRALPMPAPIVPQTGSETKTGIPHAQEDPPAGSAPILTPLPSMPRAQVTPEVQPSLPTLPAPVTRQIGVPDPAPMTGSDDFQEQLDRLFARIDSLERKIEQDVIPVSADGRENAQTRSAPDLSLEIKALQENVEILQKEIRALSATPTPARAASPRAQTRPSVETKSVIAQPSSPTSPKPRPSSASPVYELRAAQPGTAWIAQKGQRDIRSVSVGDRLPGIGQILAVSYEDGLWIVEGTTGRITQ